MFAARTNWDLRRNRFSAAVEARRASGKRLLDLSASNPTEVGIEYDEAAVLGALADPKSLRYEPEAKGLQAAREAVCEYYRERGVEARPENVLLTTSTSEAYSRVFRLLCEAGDEVLTPAPSYPLLEFLGTLEDVRLRQYPLIYDHGWQMDMPSLRGAAGASQRGEAVEEAVDATPVLKGMERARAPEACEMAAPQREMKSRARAVVVVNPNNPTGQYVKAGERAGLNALCAERGMAVIADEVFWDYPLEEVRRESFAGNLGALTFTTSGLSKVAGLPQMKVAWLVVSGPEGEVAEAMSRLEVMADTYLSMSAPVQHALGAWLAQAPGVQAQLKRRIRRNLKVLDEVMAGQEPVRRLEVEGGWYAVLRVPATQSDEDLAVGLLERGVLVHPGHFYDFAQDGYLVVSLITPEEEFAEGVRVVVGSA